MASTEDPDVLLRLSEGEGIIAYTKQAAINLQHRLEKKGLHTDYYYIDPYYILSLVMVDITHHHATIEETEACTGCADAAFKEMEHARNLHSMR